MMRNSQNQPLPTWATNIELLNSLAIAIAMHSDHNIDQVRALISSYQSIDSVLDMINAAGASNEVEKRFTEQNRRVP